MKHALDKDIDDVLHLTVASRHIVYTRTYDVEGEIFGAGNLVRACAATSGLDEAEVNRNIGDPTAWLRSCALRWKEWLAICIVCRKHVIKGCPNYGVISQVNDQGTGTTSAKKLLAYLARAHMGSTLNALQFHRSYKAARRLVEHLISSGRHGIVFKGRWYVTFASTEMLRIAAGRPIDAKAVHAGLIGALAAGLDYVGAWARHYVDAVSAIVDGIA